MIIGEQLFHPLMMWSICVNGIGWIPKYNMTDAELYIWLQENIIDQFVEFTLPLIEDSLEKFEDLTIYLIAAHRTSLQSQKTVSKTGQKMKHNPNPIQHKAAKFYNEQLKNITENRHSRLFWVGAAYDINFEGKAITVDGVHWTKSHWPEISKYYQALLDIIFNVQCRKFYYEHNSCC